MVEILSIEYSYTVDKLLALCKRKDNGEYLSLPLYDITLVSLKPTEINRAEFPKEITSNKTLESENPTEKALYLMNIFIILGFLSLACYVFYKNNNPNDMGDHGDYEVRCVEGYKYKYAKIRGVASKTGAKVVTGDTKLDINGVNGVYREGDKVWLSRNMAPHYKASTCRLVIQEGDKPAEMWRFPHTSEDFYYEKDTDILWSCTEAPSGHLFVWSAMDTKAILKNTKNIGKKPSNRIMFGVKRSSYK